MKGKANLYVIDDLVDPDDEDLTNVTSITDEAVTFTSAIYGLSIDKKTSGILVTLLVLPESGVTNLNILPLQRQRLQATLVPVKTVAGNVVPSATALEDPVQARMFASRMARMMDGWVSADDGPPEP